MTRPDRRGLKHGRQGEAAQALADEVARLRWLGDALPGQRLLHFEGDAGQACNLLSSEVPGRSAYDGLEAQPERAVPFAQALAGFLRRLHALPINTCPFDVQLALRMAAARQGLEAGLVDASGFDEARAGLSPEQVWAQLQALLPTSPDLVLTHGDYSLDKVLLDEAGQITGFIDLGRLGVADRYQDLAICWNCVAEFGELAQQAFMHAYGIAEPDERKLALHLCLDEFF